MWNLKSEGRFRVTPIRPSITSLPVCCGRVNFFRPFKILAKLLGRNSSTTGRPYHHSPSFPSSKMNDTDVESEIVELYNEGKWREIVDFYSENAFLPWIWPSIRDLEFIADCCRKQNGRKLISVGCGSGLLEWLLSKSTGIDVLGIELDESWWTSKYAKKVFIPMFFIDEANYSHEVAKASDVVLLFCYFNNEKAFTRYIEAFAGNCFIVIGPGPGKPTYTVPQPFSLPGRVGEHWKLNCHQEIGNSNNFIAAYVRVCTGS